MHNEIHTHTHTQLNARRASNYIVSYDMTLHIIAQKQVRAIFTSQFFGKN